MNVNFSKGVLWTLAAIFFYSCGHGAVAAISAEVPVYQVQFLQYLTACPLFFLFSGKRTFEKPTNIKLYLFRCIAGISASFFFMMAIRHLHLLDATLLNMTSPFYMPIIGGMWLKEKCSPLIWPLLALGFLGTALIFPPTKEVFQPGAIFALVSGLFSAVALSSLRALSQRNERTSKVVFSYMAFGMIVTGTMCLFHWHPLSVRECFVGIFGGGCLGLNQICLCRSFRLATASSLAPMGYFSFVFSAAIGWLVFHQPIHFRIVLGALLICITGVLTHRVHWMQQRIHQ
jgi:drug/metabolite transporter (DMT)-like permease